MANQGMGRFTLTVNKEALLACLEKNGRVLVVMCAALVVLTACSGCLTSLPGLSSQKSSSESGPSAGSGYPIVSPTTVYQTPGSEGGSCRQGLTPCGSNCVDTSVDIGNCGGCSMPCPSNALCRGGECYCKDGYMATDQGECAPVTVPTAENTKTGSNQPQYSCEEYPGMTPCDDGFCWSFTEREHCGSCSNICSLTQDCMSGQCVDRTTPASPSAPASGTSTAATGGTCGAKNEGTLCHQSGGPDLCVNLKVSNSHCGKCFNACPTGTACVNGQCTTTPCTKTGNTMCNGICTSLDYPPNLITKDCGGCGQQCPSGNICRAGVCEAFVCPGTHLCGGYFCCPAGTDNPCSGEPLKQMYPGTTWCGSDCRNLASDASNCGSCGTKCSNGQSCVKGICGTAAGFKLATTLQTLDPCIGQPGVTNCNGKCYNLKTDSSHCGTCTNACQSPTTCVDGSCKCATGNMVCGGVCVDTTTDNNNCGTCGIKCGTGTRCSQRSCAKYTIGGKIGGTI